MNPRRAIAIALFCVAGAVVAWRVRTWIRISQGHLNRADHFSTESSLLEANRRFYDLLWSDSRVVRAQRFNTWPLVEGLLPRSPTRLEVGPGLRPRLPISGTTFVDLSERAVAKLCMEGADAREGEVSALPFEDHSVDLVCALDIVEHAESDDAAFVELARIVKPLGYLLLSVPLHASSWSSFDDFVGHGRRYDPGKLVAKLAAHGFLVESSAAYGMLPRFPRLVDFGMRCLLHRRKRAMWYYTHLFMPIGLCFQSKLRFSPGMISLPGMDEVLLVCRKRGE